MAKSALISRHVVLPKYLPHSTHTPVYAVILVSEGHIESITQAEQFTPVKELMRRYEGWNPVDCEEMYVSPGLVDVNVQANGPWEGLEETTKAGVAGGVTFMLVEPSLYALSEDPQQALYCDIGHTLVIAEQTDLPALSPSVFALKTYLSPPSTYIPGSLQTLESALSLATTHQLPLFIDPIVGNPRMMYMASPCRLSSLEERSNTSDFPEDKVFAGAFAEDLSPDSSGSSEEEAEKPLFPQENRNGLISEMDSWRLHLPSKSVEIEEEEKEPALQLESVNSTEKLSRRRRSAKLKTIYDDLDLRIKKMEHSIADLSAVEQLAYGTAGETSFGFSRKRSLSLNNSDIATLLVQTNGKKRPRPLAMHSVAPKTSKDRVYLAYMANHPDHWEANGISSVLSVLADKQPCCKVHFCNVSSASAISRITTRQIGETTITVETSPSYLFFTALTVPDGDTRLKSSPPIRNKQNCNLLWDLLKLSKIDILASHHQPIAPQFKYLDLGNFKKAVPGIASLGLALQAVWTRLRAPMVQSQSSDSYIMRLAKWMAGNPAALVGVAAERGSIAVGKWADLVVWEPETLIKVEGRGKFPAMCPYQGAKLRGKVVKVYVRGSLAFDNGSFYPVGSLQTRAHIL